MSENGPRPSPLFRPIASLLLRGECGDVVLGDLEEGYVRHLEQGMSVSAAQWWYLTQTIGSAWSMHRSPEAEVPEPAPPKPRRGDRPMAQFKGDLKYAFKSLWRRPGFALPVILTLALGMGVSATIFSVVEAVLIRAPKFKEPERLVMVWNRQLEDTDSSNLVSGADFADLRERSTILEDIAGVGEVLVAPVLGTEQPSFARLGQSSANLFDVLGIEPFLGRLLEVADQTPLDPQIQQSGIRPPRPVVLSHNYWVRMFDSDPDILGRTLRTFTWENVVVGVLPPDFSLVLPAEARVGEDLGAAIDLWGTFRTDYRQWERDDRRLRLIARIANGRQVADARGELESIAAQLRAEHSLHEERGFQLDVENLIEERASHLRPLLVLLSCAVLCVLLVACVNASGLLLARMMERSKELAIRAALGAGRFTLARLAFLESLVLAFTGGLLGLIVAVFGMELLKWLRPAGLPQAGELHLNQPVLLFAMMVVPFAAVVAGLLPTLRAARRCRDGLTVRAGTPTRGHRRLGEALVTTQIALTVLLLVGTGLMLRSFVHLQQVPLGFEPDSVLTVDISTVGQPPGRSSDTGVADWFERRRNQERALSQILQELPGVEAAGAVFPVPLNGVYARTSSYSLQAEGDERRQGVVYYRNVWPGYFESLGTPILQGRDFVYDDDQKGVAGWEPQDGQERTDSPRVVIDARLAKRLWPGENPISRRLTYSIYSPFSIDAEVIGVVPFVPQGNIQDTMETIYIPRSYYRSQELTLTLKLAANTSRQRLQITDAVRSIFPDSPVNFKPLDVYVHRALAPTRFVLTLLGVFAATALFLASMGLYGTMALTVSFRTNEIGVHMALGAQPKAIGWKVVLRTLIVASVGVGAGLCAAFATSRLLASYLVEISATDPQAFVLAAVVQLVVAGLAACIPAHRAAAVDPITALRHD